MARMTTELVFVFHVLWMSHKVPLWIFSQIKKKCIQRIQRNGVLYSLIKGIKVPKKKKIPKQFILAVGALSFYASEQKKKSVRKIIVWICNSHSAAGLMCHFWPETHLLGDALHQRIHLISSVSPIISDLVELTIMGVDFVLFPPMWPAAKS